ncbi:MAG: sugar transferase [Myxococcota bacterium]|nr:sugar transferase [Myxococcota bacterium]
MEQQGWRFLTKRVFDRAAAAIGLGVTAPLIAATALAIRGAMGSPVLFTQERPGLGGRVFRLYKFRTMSAKASPCGELLPDAQRLTRLGSFLRATSLDELPQLLNVLRGELSLVGPRPLLTRYLERYTPEQMRRHQVMPGITGWAQVNGRNANDWATKLSYDVWYVENWSLMLDFRILALTIVRVLNRTGVSREGHATMPEFVGAS